MERLFFKKIDTGYLFVSDNTPFPVREDVEPNPVVPDEVLPVVVLSDPVVAEVRDP